MKADRLKKHLQSLLWKETKLWLKYYRTLGLQEYNNNIGPLLDLYRKMDLDVEHGKIITKLEFRDMIKNLQKVQNTIQ